MTDRATIAEAIAAAVVPTVLVGEKYRASLQPGHGFVRYAGSTRAANGFGFIDTWEVWIALSQDRGSAEGWIDEHRAGLVAAIDPVLRVTTLTPADLVLGPGPAVNGLIIAGTRAASDL